MFNKNDTTETPQPPLLAAKEPEQKPYTKPKLEELGDLRTLTLGASFGNFVDSETTGLGWV